MSFIALGGAKGGDPLVATIYDLHRHGWACCQWLAGDPGEVIKSQEMWLELAISSWVHRTMMDER
jgi:hypothetical protein